MKKTETKIIADGALAAYRSNKDLFETSLPELAAALHSVLSTVPQQSGGRSPFGLTENERGFRLAELEKAAAKLANGVLSGGEAQRAVEDCAVLIRDGSLPWTFDHATLVGMAESTLGRRLSSFSSRKTVNLDQGAAQPANVERWLVRGLLMQLTWDYRLVRVVVDPQDSRVRREAMTIVGSPLSKPGGRHIPVTIGERVLFSLSALRAVLDGRDEKHDDAALVFERCLDWHTELWTTNYTLLELSRVLGAERFAKTRRLVDNFFHIYWVDPATHAAAEHLWAKEDTKTLSDVVSELVSDRLGAGLVTP